MRKKFKLQLNLNLFYSIYAKNLIYKYDYERCVEAKNNP